MQNTPNSAESTIKAAHKRTGDIINFRNLRMDLTNKYSSDPLESQQEQQRWIKCVCEAGKCLNCQIWKVWGTVSAFNLWKRDSETTALDCVMEALVCFLQSFIHPNPKPHHLLLTDLDTQQKCPHPAWNNIKADKHARFLWIFLIFQESSAQSDKNRDFKHVVDRCVRVCSNAIRRVLCHLHC